MSELKVDGIANKHSRTPSCEPIPDFDHNKEEDKAREEEDVLEANAKNILISMIGQLSKGADLHRVTLPTFVLEPRSFLERITDFMSHPEFIINAHKLETPQERFMAVTQFYLSGWHIRPKGVKKPYNPVLGEYFRSQWDFTNGTKCYFVSEQISHHPPVSAFTFASPDNQFIIEGEMKPKSKFYGTSAATFLEGTAKIRFLNHPDEVYIINYPSIYVYGILFGKLTYELGDTTTIKCPKTDLICKAEFKTKGLFAGSYHGLSARIKSISTGETIYELNGKWSEKIFTKDRKTEVETLFFDVETLKVFPKSVPSINEQHYFESRRLWKDVTKCLKEKNIDGASEVKTKIEDEQRDRCQKWETENKPFKSRFYDVKSEESQWKLGELPSDLVEANALITDFIFGYQPEDETGLDV